MPDIQVENHGSIFLFRPITPEGKEFLENEVQEDAIWFGGALAVEPRFAENLAAGATGYGLEVQ